MNRSLRVPFVAFAGLLFACSTDSQPPAGTDAGPDLPGDTATEVDYGNPFDITGPQCTVDDDCKGAIAGLGPCEKASCQAQKCVRTEVADGTPCDDGAACTKNDTCQAGACKGIGTPDCLCTVDADCKDDDDRCNGKPKCSDGTCVGDPATVKTCEASANPCRVNECAPATGECVESAKADGTVCDDGDACTDGTTCKAGACQGAAKDCDDKNDCTTDSCDKVKGCVHENRTGGCDDGDFCTINDACAGGTCVGATNPECKCKDDKGCAPYENGDPCDGTLVCKDHKCEVDPATIIPCDETPPACKAWACDPLQGKCALGNLPDETPCDDGSACTSKDKCRGGECKGDVVTCADGDECTDDSCDPATGCVFTPNSAECSDGNFCTDNDHCSGGTCAGTAKPGCECGSDAECASFEDGDLCNGTLICLGSKCVVDNSTIKTCAKPANPCKAAYCESTTGECKTINVADATACDDGDACTLGDRCVAGACQKGSTPRVCNDGNPCTDDSCDALAGCVTKPNAALCDDQNSCTTGDACYGGKCVGTPTPDCSCQLDVNCEPYEDGNFCNGTLACLQKKCVVDPTTVITCKSDNPCIGVTCEPATGACIQTPAADGTLCSDGDLCTQVDICLKGQCTGKAVSCDDANPCTDDACDPAKGCTHANNTAACDDGSTCTTGDTCQGGFCKGTQKPGCVCAVNADCGVFEDGDKCNGTLKCLQNQCVLDPTTIVACDTSGDNACLSTRCNKQTGVCDKVQAPNGEACDDGSVCTTVDKCLGGNCVGSVPVSCDDHEECTTDSCDAKTGCGHVAATGGACEDGSKCTTGDACLAGFCVPGGKLDCADGDPCTIDSCDPATGCVHDPFPAGTCCHGDPDCDDKDACTTDKCVGNSCTHNPVISPGCCKPDCALRTCGPDGCGGSCGTCGAGDFCSLAGVCKTECVEQCAGKECGPSGCGTDCGHGVTECGTGETCVGGVCTACAPACAGRVCGTDACGGTCGTCDVGMNCTPEGQCVDACSSCTLGVSCPDLGFESGTLAGWTWENDVTIQHNLGATAAPQGWWMAAVGNGLFAEGVGNLKISLCLPAGKTGVSFRWKFYSKEFVDYCGSMFQDYVRALAYSPMGTVTLLDFAIDDLCPPAECGTCGAKYVGLDPADVVFDSDDLGTTDGVWTTPWQKLTADLTSIVAAGQPLTLSFFVGDVGDSIYDSVLLVDDIVFNP